MDMADVILFMVDGKDGLTHADREVGNMLRRTGEKVILLVNKVDNPAIFPKIFTIFTNWASANPFLSLQPICSTWAMSSTRLPGAFEGAGTEEEEEIKVAVIGKPNVGKSSLINALLGEKRVIVSPVARTTRDSIDTPFSWGGDRYMLIDTAGIRRKKQGQRGY